MVARSIAGRYPGSNMHRPRPETPDGVEPLFPRVCCASTLPTSAQLCRFAVTELDKLVAVLEVSGSDDGWAARVGTQDGHQFEVLAEDLAWLQRRVGS